ncbi:MAG: anti-sigma factor [Bryobacteraceae bacterium]
MLRSEHDGRTRRAEETPRIVQITPPGVPPNPAERVVPGASPAEVADLKDKLAKAESALAARGTAGTPSGEVALLQKALSDTSESLRQSRQALAQQELKTVALERDLQAERTQLAAAVRDRQDAETRVKVLAEDRSAVDARDRQIRALTVKVEQLERENVEFRRAVNRTRRELDQNLQVASFLNSPALKMVKLRPTEKSENALAYAFLEGSRVLFVATKMPDLPAGRQYQLWLMRGRGAAVVSGGVFSFNGQRAIIEIRDPKLVADVRALAVTDEPTGGSPLPTGHKYLISTT